MNSENDYFARLISDIIKKHIILYGPQIAVSKACEIEGLAISDKGEVETINGNSEYILRQLIAKYMELFSHITKDVVLSILEDYPKEARVNFEFLKENRQL